jgi:indolepyruvate ferredoxin oxidoreductase
MQDDVVLFDASELARVAMGDAIFSNMIVFGAAWQHGLIPVGEEALLEAIALNGAAVEQNQRAFRIGRWAAADPDEAARQITPNVVEMPRSPEDAIAYRAEHLTAYQGKRLAKRYLRLLEGIGDQRLREAVAKGYHKLLSYKDEYEVARLLLDTREKARAEFDGDFDMTFHLAPPLLARKGADGRPQKRAFGAWMERPMRVLAGLKWLRGTPADPFGYTAERKMERALIRQYERDIAEVLPKLTDDTRDAIVALAELPLQIKGFGPVKQANEARAAKTREALLATIREGGAPVAQAAE